MKKLMHKFSFAQMVSNSDGKTSGSGTMGCLVVATGCLGFLCGIAAFIWGAGKPEIMLYSTGFIGAGVTLLGFRKSKDNKVKSVYPNDAGEMLKS